MSPRKAAAHTWGLFVRIAETSQKTSRRKAALKYGAAFLLGMIAMGIVTGEPEIRYRVIHSTKTETITETVVQTETVIPPACYDLASVTNQIVKASVKLDVSSSHLLDIMSRTRIAVTEGSNNALNNLETELRDLNSKTVGAVTTIGELANSYTTAEKACKNGSTS